ncbi:hypothetical protein ACI3SI_14670 [Lactococcus lactis]
MRRINLFIFIFYPFYGPVTAQLTVDGTTRVIVTGSYKATITSTLVTGP